ncbi:hypothetical protein ABZP36_013905, partial [Zizania latifolia]
HGTTWRRRCIPAAELTRAARRLHPSFPQSTSPTRPRHSPCSAALQLRWNSEDSSGPCSDRSGEALKLPEPRRGHRGQDAIRFEGHVRADQNEQEQREEQGCGGVRPPTCRRAKTARARHCVPPRAVAAPIPTTKKVTVQLPVGSRARLPC